MNNYEFIRDEDNQVIGIAQLGKCVFDFNEHLEELHGIHGDLERHHKDNKIWVTRYVDDEIVMSLDLVEKELAIYFI